VLAGLANGPDRAAIRAITLGTLRWYLRLAPAVEELLETRVASAVRALLNVAAHQIEYSRNVPEATVHAAVDAARLLGTPRATGLANAVLRRFDISSGTPSLIATLWNVHKRSSQRLLNDFYQLWIGEQLPKWRALQTAQQRLHADPEYSHPYHWAPFVLIGDWG